MSVDNQLAVVDAFKALYPHLSPPSIRMTSEGLKPSIVLEESDYMPDWTTPNPRQDNLKHLEHIKNTTSGNDPTKVIYEAANQMLEAGVKVTATALGEYVAQQVESSTGTQLRLDSGMAAAVREPAEKTLKSVANQTLRPKGNELSKCSASFDRLVESSTRLMPHMHQEIQDSVKRLDDSIRTSSAILGKNEKPEVGLKSVEEIQDAMRVRSGYWLGQPREIRNLLVTCDEEALKRLMPRRKPDEPEDKYEKSKSVLEMMINTIVGYSIAGEKARSRGQFMLYGPPGTGKTRLTEGLGDALGAETVILSHEELKYEDYAGRLSEYSRDGKIVPGEKPVLPIRGKIRDSVCACGSRNPIILFDEFSADSVYAGSWNFPTLKKFFSPDVESGDRKGIENLDHATIIVSTNDPPEMFPPALRSRFTEIKVSGLNGDVLEFIATTRQNEDISNLSEGLRQMDWSGYMGDAMTLVEAIIKESVAEIQKYLPTTKKYNTDEGARTLQSVISQLVYQVIIPKARNHDPSFSIPEGSMEEMIKAWSKGVTITDEDKDKSEESDVMSYAECWSDLKKICGQLLSTKAKSKSDKSKKGSKKSK